MLVGGAIGIAGETVNHIYADDAYLRVNLLRNQHLSLLSCFAGTS